MHQVYFVSVPKEEANNSEEAISVAKNFLDGNGFSGDSGFYGSPKSDWFEVGGRWSGMFTIREKWFEDFMEKCRTLAREKYPDIADDWEQTYSYGDKKKEELLKKLRVEILKLWKKFVPKEHKNLSCPLSRKGTFSWGKKPILNRHDNDDAQLLTEAQYLWLKKDYKGVEVVLTEQYEEILVENTKPSDLVGRWLVVIDYHS